MGRTEGAGVGVWAEEVPPPGKHGLLPASIGECGRRRLLERVRLFPPPGPQAPSQPPPQGLDPGRSPEPTGHRQEEMEAACGARSGERGLRSRGQPALTQSTF